jgi:hypothetical protein
MQVVGVRGRDQSFNLRELTSEKPCGDTDIGEIEDCVEITVPEHDRPVPVCLATCGQPLNLRERLCGNENLATRFNDCHSREIAERETVRVGGDEPEASFSSDHKHSGELWCPRVVDKRRSYNLSQAIGKNSSRDFDPFLLRHSKTRDLGTNGNSDQKLGPS